MNVEIGTEAPIFLFWEYLLQIFGIFPLQCSTWKCLRSFSGTGNYSAAVVSIQGTGIPPQPSESQLSIWSCSTSFSGTGNYSVAVVSVQGTGIPLQARGSQVPGVV
jgi:hypothetical protein